MENIKARNVFCILTGDFNKLVVNNELGIPGNHAEVSLGEDCSRKYWLPGTGCWSMEWAMM